MRLSSHNNDKPRPFEDYIPHVFRGIHHRIFDNQNRVVLPKSFFIEFEFKFFYSYYISEFDIIIFMPMDINSFCRIGDISDDETIIKISEKISSIYNFEGEINYVRGKNRITVNDYMIHRCGMSKDISILGQGPVFTIMDAERLHEEGNFIITL